jgi:hypothetical protein
MYYIHKKLLKIMANNALVQAAGLLSDVKEALRPLLEKEHNMFFIGFDARLGQMINQLNFASGGTLLDPNPVRFEPVTNFMGEELKMAKEIKMTDLSPKELERKLFNEKVNALQKELPNLTNDQILESYINEPIVIRGLARRAELDNYRDGEVNSTFLDQIRTAFNDFEAAKALAEKDEVIKDENLMG